MMLDIVLESFREQGKTCACILKLVVNLKGLDIWVPWAKLEKK